MTELAGFLNQRDSVRWTLDRSPSGQVAFHASHPKSLAHQTWVFPQANYRDARAVDGQATISVQDGRIFVAAADGRKLSVVLNSRRDAGRSNADAIEAKRPMAIAC